MNTDNISYFIDNEINNEILFFDNFNRNNEQNEFQINQPDPDQYKEDNLSKIQCPKCNKLYNHKYSNSHIKFFKRKKTILIILLIILEIMT